MKQQAAEGDKTKSKDGYKKWQKFAMYKYDVTNAIAYANQALYLLSEEEGGQARRCSQEALELIQKGIDNADVYHSTNPKTDSSIYRECHQEIRRFLYNVDRRAERENAIVHMRAVPIELPPPLPKKNITKDLLDEQIEALVSDYHSFKCAEVDTESEGKEAQSSCWRWLATWVAFPLLLIISLIGAIVWLVLLPFKLICCPCGMMLQTAWNIMERMLKAPLHAIQWAAGNSSQDTREMETVKVEEV